MNDAMTCGLVWSITMKQAAAAAASDLVTSWEIEALL